MSEESNVVGSSTPAASSPAPTNYTPPSDDFVSKAEMNRVVHERTSAVKQKALQEGYEKARAELQQTPSQNGHTSMGGMQQLTADDIKKIFDERSEQVKNETLLSHTFDTFAQKMQAAKDSHPDFEELVQKLNLPTIPEVALLATQMENTSDIMYDLAKNPYKISAILNFARDPRTMHLAQAEMHRLSNSIKANKEAINTPTTNDPLSQIKPSPSPTDNGQMTTRDWREKYKGRG